MSTLSGAQIINFLSPQHMRYTLPLLKRDDPHQQLLAISSSKSSSLGDSQFSVRGPQAGLCGIDKIDAPTQNAVFNIKKKAL